MSKKAYNYVVLVCSLVIILAIVLIFVINSENKVKNSFVFNKHLDDTILTFELNDDDQSITLKELSYYILLMEANVNHTAALYDPDNSNSFWNLYIEHTFVKSMAKDTSIDMCIRDNIYYLEATANNLTLDSKEANQVSEETSYIYYNLTGKQVDATELSYQDIYNVRYKIALATKYISKLMNEDSYTKEELNVNGSYYEALQKKYPVTIAEVWDEVTLGNITIDN